MNNFGIVGDSQTICWPSLDKRSNRKLTHYLPPECDSFSDGESRHQLAAGGRIMRRVHVSPGWAD
jgi:hypothetical protein